MRGRCHPYHDTYRKLQAKKGALEGAPFRFCEDQGAKETGWTGGGARGDEGGAERGNWFFRHRTEK